MFEAFESAFSGVSKPEIGASSAWDVLIDRHGGSSLKRGLYRVLKRGDVGEWNERIALAFPEFAGRVTSFGIDWLGRVFATDAQRFEDGSPGVVMLEIGTGEALELPCHIVSFHNEELIEFEDAALASSFYQRWLDHGGTAPQYRQCIGYKQPLFLGGEDDISNLELSDLDVYWHVIGQVLASTKH